MVYLLEFRNVDIQTLIYENVSFVLLCIHQSHMPKLSNSYHLQMGSKDDIQC